MTWLSELGVHASDTTMNKQDAAWGDAPGGRERGIDRKMHRRWNAATEEEA
jgi:hypothetical protein